MSRSFQTEAFRFETKQFVVLAVWSEDFDYQYDGDEGETQAALDRGEFVAFDTTVYVMHKASSAILGRSDLGGSVYAADEVETFFNAHRGSDPMNRNCSIMRAAHPAGPNVSICHYFPDMVREAVRAARLALAAMPRVRQA